SHLSSLPEQKCRIVGPVLRSEALSLPGLPQELQCPDRNAAGAVAEARSLENLRSSGRGERERAQGCEAGRRQRANGVPVAAPVFKPCQSQQSRSGQRHSGSGRDVFSRMNRAPRKRGGKASKPGLSDEQVPVLVLRDRSG